MIQQDLNSRSTSYSWILYLIYYVLVGSLAIWIHYFPWYPTSVWPILILGTPLVLCILWVRAGAILLSKIEKKYKVYNVVSVGICTLFAWFVVCLMWSDFQSGRDHFADNLVIPKDIVLLSPDKSRYFTQPSKDPFYEALFREQPAKSKTDETSICANITNLAYMHNNHLDITRRYFATDPRWRVFKEHEKIFTTHRFLYQSGWHYPDYFDKHTISFQDSRGLYHLFRLSIGSLKDRRQECFFNGIRTDKIVENSKIKWTITPGSPSYRQWIDVKKNSEDLEYISSSPTFMANGETKRINLLRHEYSYNSQCFISSETLIVEVIEKSHIKQRILTQAGLKYLDDQFAPLIRQPTWQTVKSNLSQNSIGTGDTSLQLIQGARSGHYDYIIWANPKEPGMIYLKAYEVTRNYRLSESTLKKRTNEWIGWSEDSSELFFSSNYFVIYEGDPDKPYAARFEVWFVPDSGNSERKILEKNYKIEGASWR